MTTIEWVLLGWWVLSMAITYRPILLTREHVDDPGPVFKLIIWVFSGIFLPLLLAGGCLVMLSYWLFPPHAGFRCRIWHNIKRAYHREDE